MAEPPPLPVVDLVAFGLLVAVLVGVHAVRMRIREEVDPVGSEASQRSETMAARLSRLELSTRAFQAGAWLVAWYGVSIGARLVGFV